MSWYLEPMDDANETGDEANAVPCLLGAAGAVLTMKGAVLGGATVAGPVGGALAGIAWVGFGAFRRVLLSQARKGAS